MLMRQLPRLRFDMKSSIKDLRAHTDVSFANVNTSIANVNTYIAKTSRRIYIAMVGIATAMTAILGLMIRFFS